MDEVRLHRLESQIQEKISVLILNGSIKDPRIDTLLSVTRVILSGDMCFAKVYVSSFTSDAKAEKSADALNHAAGFIQKQLARTLKTRNTPKLKFIRDTSLKDGFEINKKIEDLMS